MGIGRDMAEDCSLMMIVIEVCIFVLILIKFPVHSVKSDKPTRNKTALLFPIVALRTFALICFKWRFNEVETHIYDMFEELIGNRNEMD